MNANRSVVGHKKKSFWKMVRSILLPRRVIRTFASCGGGRGKQRKRMEKITRDLQPRDRSSRQEDNRIPPPQLTSTDLEPTFENLTITPSDIHSENGADVRRSRNINIVTIDVIDNPANYSHQDIRNNESNPNNRTDTVSPEVRGPTSVNEINVDDFDCNLENIPRIDSTIGDVVVRRSKKIDPLVDDCKFHGWRKSSIEVAPAPPMTLKWIPNGLQLEDKVMWITEKQPERAVVRWIGKIRDQFHAGIEFERRIGNSSGIYGYGLSTYQRLFTCDLGYGRFVPVTELILYTDFHDKGLKAGFICVICRDDFLELPDFHSLGDGQMVATKCGHLYHQYCLLEWFSSSKQLCHQCPHCQHVIEMDDIIRLFPAQV